MRRRCDSAIKYQLKEGARRNASQSTFQSSNLPLGYTSNRTKFRRKTWKTLFFPNRFVPVGSFVFSDHFFSLLFVLFYHSLILILTPLTFFMQFCCCCFLILHVSSSPTNKSRIDTKTEQYVHKVALFFMRSDRLIVSVPRGSQSLIWFDVCLFFNGIYNNNGIYGCFMVSKLNLYHLRHSGKKLV